MASRFASISDEEVKEFTEKLQNEASNKNTKKKTLYDIKVFKEYLDACDEKREIEDITPVELQEIIKNLFLLCERKMVKNTNPRPSERLSKASTGIFAKTTMDSPCLTTRNFTKSKIF